MKVPAGCRLFWTEDAGAGQITGGRDNARGNIEKSRRPSIAESKIAKTPVVFACEDIYALGLRFYRRNGKCPVELSELECLREQ